MSYAIKVENLHKSYGSNEILKGISFSVSHGEIFAVLGINGAGKTTTLECIEGLRKFESGTIKVNGSYGVQLQSSSIPKDMQAIEALTLFAKWRRAPIDSEHVSKLGVEPFLKKRYSHLSTGQKRRLHLALALIGDPDIIFLDEPTAGLDVEGRVSIHTQIMNLKARGKTILLASHDMAEVEELCDKIIIIKNGEIAFSGSAAELTETAQSVFELKVRFSKAPDFSAAPSLSEFQSDKGYYQFTTDSLERTISQIIGCCKAQNIVLIDIKVERAGIERRFLEIAREEI